MDSISLFSTSFGFVIYNVLTAVILDYGLHLIPLIVYWWHYYVKIVDNNKITRGVAQASIGNMFNWVVIVYPLMLIFAFIPTSKLGIINDLLDRDFYKINPSSTYEKSPFEQNFENYIEQNVGLGNQEFNDSVPLLQGLLIYGINGITYNFNQAITKIVNPNDKKSLNRLLQKFNETSSSDITEERRARYNTFYKFCYEPARSKFNNMVEKGYINPEQRLVDTITGDIYWDNSIPPEAYDWPGGSYYLDSDTGRGFYRFCPKTNTTTKSCYYPGTVSPGGLEMPLVESGERFFLSCGGVWDVIKNGLNKNLGIYDGYSKTEQDKLLRTFIQNKEGGLTAWFGEIYDNVYGFGESVYNTVTNPTSAIKDALATLGIYILSFLKELAYYAVNAAIPFVLSVVQIFTIVIMPIALLLSGFNPATLLLFFWVWFLVGTIPMVMTIMNVLQEIFLSIYAGTTEPTSALANLVGPEVNSMEVAIIELILYSLHIVMIKYYVFFVGSVTWKPLVDLGESMTGGLDDIGRGANPMKMVGSILGKK